MVLLIAAFLCFMLAAAGVPNTKINLIALGLMCWVLTLLIASAR